jgi:hypothetical protein
MARMRAATIDQILRTDKGSLVTVEGDVLGIAKQLHEIDPCLRLKYSDAGGEGRFIVYEVTDNGPGKQPDERIVTTSLDCDQRILDRVREISSEGYDYVAELERINRERDAELDHNFTEQVGEAGERLHHILKNKQSRIAIPGYIKRRMDK